VACIDDNTVFGWVREYFISNSKVSNIEQVPVEPVKKNKADKPQKPQEEKVDEIIKKPKTKKEKGVVEGQLDLFEELA